MKVIDRTAVDKEDVRHLPEKDLAKMGVRLANRVELVLECNECGETWAPQLDAVGKLPFDYWVCPAKCNAH